MKLLHNLVRDGDLGLLLLVFLAGLIPLLADAAAGRALGAEATVGGLASLCAGWGLLGRVNEHRQAVSVSRELLQK